MIQDRLFLDVHAIQSVPPSNINRDDTGSPKTALYGGVRRARVSSQAWKRAMRQYFYDHSVPHNLGVRSLEIPRYISQFILEEDASLSEEEALEKAIAVLKTAKISVDNKKNRLKALFFIGQDQARALAKLGVQGNYKKEDVYEALKNNKEIDIVLFGRMVADDPSFNVDATTQVAHAIATHAVPTEFDFYTAVDDLAPEDNAGAGMLGTIEYNSATLYRYACVAVHEFLHQVQDKALTKEAMALFIEAFVKSMPTGKINTFANQSLPQFLMIELRNDRPINLVTAFEKPIKSQDGYSDPSIARLLEEDQKSLKFSNPPLARFIINTSDVQVSRGQEFNSLEELLEKVEEELDSLLTD